MEQHIKDAHLLRLRKIFRENFLRELSDEQASEYLDKMYTQTRAELARLPNFGAKATEKYLSGNLEIVFSPNAINAEVLRVVNEIGIEALEASSKYKRMAEMVDASCLALALKKAGKGEWVIKGQDAPDILLVQPDPEHTMGKPFRAISLEIMQIPEFAKEKFGADVEADAAQFIQDKKYTKRYEGIPHLLVHLNFDHIGFKTKRLSEKLCEEKNSPFRQIWIRVNADPVSQVMKMVLVYPVYMEFEFDFLNDRHLMF